MNLPGIQWTPGEAATVNEFLNSPIGRKWLAVLQFRKPAVDLSSTERTALSGAYAAGYEYLLFNQIPATRIALKEQESMSLKAIDPTKD